MHNLCIDIGNSFTKCGIFLENEFITSYTFEKLESYQIDKYLKDYSIHNVILSSVKKPDSVLLKSLRKRWNLILLSPDLKLPITIKYESPNTLGQDRLAAVCGAVRLYSDCDLLVIGIGTCITYDLINKQKEFLGGNISPGLDMRLKAMHHFTAKLPLVEKNLNAALMGTTTKKALQSGALKGVEAEIIGMISLFNEKYGDLKVILTGGGSKYYVKKLKNPIFAHPNLVLLGLNHILTLNV